MSKFKQSVTRNQKYIQELKSSEERLALMKDELHKLSSKSDLEQEENQNHNHNDNDLLKYFENNPGRLIFKWMHYFEIYDRYFSRFRNREVHVVEIGVAQGGSLQMWKKYFGDYAYIYGVDINKRSKRFEEERIKIIIGEQQNRNFLRQMKNQCPRIDILIDDGGHRMLQQINTFEELFPHISENGVYLCEDLHTSYWPQHGGGYRNPNSFIEYSKTLIDKLVRFVSSRNS